MMVILSRTPPPQDDKIQHSCLDSFGQKRPSCLSFLIVMGHNFPNSWATAQNFWSGHNKVLNFSLYSIYTGGEFGMWSIFLIKQMGNMFDWVKGSSIIYRSCHMLFWYCFSILLMFSYSDFELSAHLTIVPLIAVFACEVIIHYIALFLMFHMYQDTPQWWWSYTAVDVSCLLSTHCIFSVQPLTTMNTSHSSFFFILFSLLWWVFLSLFLYSFKCPGRVATHC